MPVFTDMQDNRSSFAWFLLVGALLIGLFLFGVWWAKERSQSIVQRTIGTTQQPTKENTNKPVKQKEPVETAVPTPAPAPQTQPKNTTPVPSVIPPVASGPNAAPARLPQTSAPEPRITPVTGPQNLPATGPAIVDILLSGLMMGLAGYFGIRLLQIRQAIQPR